MTKTELIAAVAEKASISKAQAGEAVNATIEVIIDTVAAGEAVTLPGFGTFEKRHRDERQGRNPKTGENEVRPINEVATSHLARRTFIGGLYFRVSDPNLIGKMSGHVEGSKAFKRYRNIEDETLQDIINNNLG